MDDVARKLLDIKDKIQKAKRNKDQAEARHQDRLDRLRDEFGCDSVEQAQELLDSMTSELEDKEEKLKSGVLALEQAYDWKI